MQTNEVRKQEEHGWCWETKIGIPYVVIVFIMGIVGGILIDFFW